VILAALAGALAADLLVTGARIWTGDPQRAWASALAVEDGLVSWLGDADPPVAAHTVDAHGAFLMPGFVDGHVHLLEGGVELGGCALTDLSDAPAVRAAVAACAASGRSWLVGGGWPLPAWPDANPTATELDAVSAGRPAALFAADGHSVWLNTAALDRLGIDARTPDPPGGRIERGADGAPSGTLRESAAEWVWDRLPTPGRRARREGLERAIRIAWEAGLTGVFEANADLAALRTRRHVARRMPLRASVALETDPRAGVEQVVRLQRWRRRFDDGQLRVRAAKLFVDGVIEARTAAMLAPYADTGEIAAPDWTQTELDAVVAALVGADFDVHAHAIGDAAVRAALDAAERAGAGERVGIAHVEVVDPADLPRFAALGVKAVFQPLWAYPDDYIRDLTLPAVSSEVAARLYPIGALQRAGASLAFGSDWSVSSIAPMEGIEVAVTRADPRGGDGAVLGVDQAIALEDALRAYTRGAARQAGLPGGVLAVGAPADFVALSVNPFDVAPALLSEIQATWVVVGGRSVHAREAVLRQLSDADR
jgi:predicted amidohydrolase YtcJ